MNSSQIKQIAHDIFDLDMWVKNLKEQTNKFIDMSSF
jgi:hypothetical protein